MENARTYIKSKLENIVENIPTLKILYKYDPLSKEHLIKILPLDDYRNNIQYQDFETNIIFDFIEKYPHDSLVFFSEKDWIDIELAEIEIKGMEYQDNIPSFKAQDLLVFQNPEDDLLEIEAGILKEYKYIDSNDIERLALLENFDQTFYDMLKKIYSDFEKNGTKQNLLKKYYNYFPNEYCSNEDNYALAA